MIAGSRTEAKGGWAPGEAPILVTCPRGLAPVLAAEIESLGVPVLATHETAVETAGPLSLCPRLNLHLRTGHRVLWRLRSFGAASAADVYRGCSALPWEDVLLPEHPITVRASSDAPDAGPDGRLAALKCKDAIADRMRERCGRRPDSGPEPRGACVFVLWRAGDCRVFLDTSGVPLSFRGYRRLTVAAPMRESLAAGVLLASGWRGERPLANPMCGSGTLAIEGAWIAMRRAPGLLRARFAFMCLRGYEDAAWRALREEALRAARPAPPSPIAASDRDPAAVEAARVNARAAGVERHIGLTVGDFMECPVPGPAPLIVLNPEYGERMGAGEDLAPEYRRIGRFLRERGAGGRGVVFTGNLALSRRIGLKVGAIRTMFNGPIECRMLEFELTGPPPRP
ncbi:MAG: class I SAM-dependent RNA methyltransferase [Lentisphaerae bacterium]|nr:class I SAM-dependent RNA methyltransferase [Lentisphaerota bacterium]